MKRALLIGLAVLSLSACDFSKDALIGRNPGGGNVSYGDQYSTSGTCSRTHSSINPSEFAGPGDRCTPPYHVIQDVEADSNGEIVIRVGRYTSSDGTSVFPEILNLEYGPDLQGGIVDPSREIHYDCKVEGQEADNALAREYRCTSLRLNGVHGYETGNSADERLVLKYMQVSDTHCGGSVSWGLTYSFSDCSQPDSYVADGLVFPTLWRSQ